MDIVKSLKRIDEHPSLMTGRGVASESQEVGYYVDLSQCLKGHV